MCKRVREASSSLSTFPKGSVAVNLSANHPLDRQIRCGNYSDLFLRRTQCVVAVISLNLMPASLHCPFALTAIAFHLLELSLGASEATSFSKRGSPRSTSQSGLFFSSP